MGFAIGVLHSHISMRNTATVFLQANKEYHITEIRNNIVRYIVNGDLFFEYNYPFVLQEGCFGFHSTKSKRAIDEIRVYQLE